VDSTKTDSTGDFFFKITAKNVTNKNEEVTVYINSSKSGYEDGHYKKTITIIAYIEPVIEVTEPQEVDFGDNNTATVISGVEGEVTIQTQAGTQPDEEDPDAIGLYLEVTETGSGKLHWMNITIDYDELPDGVDPEKLRIFYWDEDTSGWKRAGNSGVDTVNKYVWANVTHLTIFAPRIAHGDITPPSIEHTPLTEVTVGEDVIISATITDEEDGVQKATLYYRKSGNTAYAKVEMVKDGDTYTGTIPASSIYLDGFEYYISTNDGNNTATRPTDINTPYSVTVSEEEEDDDDDEGNKAAFYVLAVLLVLLFIALLTFNMWSDMLQLNDGLETERKPESEEKVQDRETSGENQLSETDVQGKPDEETGDEDMDKDGDT